MAIYKDRVEAGQVLASAIEEKYGSEIVVAAIPNGGVIVGIEIAKRLSACFTLIIVRKLHIPWNREAGFGAIASDGTMILNDTLVPVLGLSAEEIKMIAAEELEEIRRREARYQMKKPVLLNRTVVVVDDGLASGFTMLSAVHALRKSGPKKVIVAVPTASADAVQRVRQFADDVLCPNVRTGFMFAVADAYENWYDVEDEEVVSLIKLAKHVLSNL